MGSSKPGVTRKRITRARLSLAFHESCGQRGSPRMREERGFPHWGAKQVGTVPQGENGCGDLLQKLHGDRVLGILITNPIAMSPRDILVIIKSQKVKEFDRSCRSAEKLDFFWRVRQEERQPEWLFFFKTDSVW